MKKLLALLMSAALVMSCCATFVLAENETEAQTESEIEIEVEKSDDIVILYTNDIHTYIDGVFSYDVISAIKDDFKTRYNHVFLVDAGDHIQGTAYGSMDKGENIITLMTWSGYDVATLGNHEFDYGMNRLNEIYELAGFPYISANFYHVADGERLENVLDSNVIFECGDEKVAFIGITTPETITKSTPAYFMNENGEFIYGISSGENATDLMADVQYAVDMAKENGATKIIALGHLGVDESSEPATSRNVIAGVSGLDAFIDGHSHSVIECENVKDADGNDVVLTQTGEYFDRIGVMLVDAETGEITADFIEYAEVYSDDGVTFEKYKLVSDIYNWREGVITNGNLMVFKNEIMSKVDSALGETIGETQLVFDNYDEIGNRLVRIKETNSGSFAADALYYLFDDMGYDVDVAVMNAGGIRNNAITGDITYKTCKEMHTFGNVACLQTVTGQQLLDALEWGSRFIGEAECGGLLHVSGISYRVDESIPNTMSADEVGAWTSGPSGAYRVSDVKIYNKETASYEPLDLDAKYNLAGYNYTLRDLGDGFAMFKTSENIVDYVMEDYMVLANYVKGFENSVVENANSPLNLKYQNFGIDYSSVGNRIVLDSDESEETETVEETAVVVPEFQPKDTEHNKNFGIIIAIFLGALGILVAYAIKIRNEN